MRRSRTLSIRSVSELIIPDDNRILYFARDRAAFRFLSHFFPAPIFMDGETWATVEHYYQAQKSHDPAYRQAIRDTLSPGMAKRLAAPPQAPRRVSAQSWFRKNGTLPRPDWHEVKLGIMRRADLVKFTHRGELGDALLATGDAELGEDSSSEPYLGDRPGRAGVELGRSGHHGSARTAARGPSRRRGSGRISRGT